MDINNVSYHRSSHIINAKPNSDNGITVLHCSDIHLGADIPFLKNNDIKTRRAEIMTTFRRITEVCKERAVDLLIIAGDLFENHGIDVSVVNSVKRCLADIPDTIVAICAGNHDYISVDCPFADDDWSDNVFIFGRELQYVEFPNMKLRLWGASFARTYMDTSLLEGVRVPFDSFTNILVMHGELLKDENQISRYNPITLEQLANSKMDYVALGHMHKTTPVQKVKDTYYAYSGCPDGHDFDEQGQKGVYLGTISKGSSNLEFLPLSKRMLSEFALDITGSYSDQQVIELIQKHLEDTYGEDYHNNLYRIILKGWTKETYQPNRQQIESALSEVLFYVKVINHSLPDLDFDILAKEVSLRGVFVKNMLERIDRCNDAFEKANLTKALYIGLNAFEKEVILLDN